MKAALLIIGLVAAAWAVEDCGKTPIPPKIDERIVNGEEVVPYSWPWQVSLCVKGGGNPQDCTLNCGGSVIHNQWIVTAGHCAPTTENSNYRIKIGVFNIRNVTESNVIIADVERQIRHPMFNSPKQLGHDISLIKLAKPITYSDHVQPVCLATTDDNLKENDLMYTTGWGRDGAGQIPPKLQQVGVIWRGRPYCEQNDKPNLFDETKVCVGGRSDNKGACNGDSGGPLVRRNDAQRWVLYGIVSYKSTGQVACVGENSPTGYGRVSAFCQFINDSTGLQLCGN